MTNRTPFLVEVLRDRAAMVISVLTLLGVGVAAWYAGQQAKSAQRMVGQAQDALQTTIEIARTDERAWIVIEPFEPVLIEKGTATSPAKYRYELMPKNVGKTSAYNVKLNAVTLFDSGALQKSAIQIANIQDKMLLGKFLGTVGMPIAHADFPPVIAPNARPASPTFFDFLVRPIVPNHYPMPMTESLVGRIDYEDIYCVKHWVKFCFVPNDANGSLGYCTFGNDEDRNSEYPLAKSVIAQQRR